MKHIYANGRSMAQILGLIKPRIGEKTEEERDEELYKKRLSRLRQLAADQDKEQGISTGRCFDYAQHDMQGVKEVQDVGDVPFNTQMPNRVRHDGDGVEDVQVRNVPHNSSILTIPQNVANVASAPTVPHLALMPAYAVADRGMQEGRDVVASRYSDTLLGTFGKTKVPCPSGIEDGKVEGGQKEEERAEALYRKRLARLRQMAADQDEGEGISTGRPFDRACIERSRSTQGDMQGVGEVQDVGDVPFNTQMPNRVRHDERSVGNVQVKGNVETQDIASLQKNISAIRRGNPLWLPGVMGSTSRSNLRTTPTFAVLLLIFMCLLSSALAQPSTLRPSSRGGAADGQKHYDPVQWARKAQDHPWHQYIHYHLHEWGDSDIKRPKDPAADLDRFPLYTYKIDMEQIGTIAVGDILPDDLLDFPLTVLNHADIVTFTTLRELSTRKYLVLDFWAAWCAPCLYSMIKWEELRDDIESEITIVGIHLDADYKADIQLRKRNWKSTQVIGPGAWLINSMFCNGTIVGPSAWIKDGRLFGFSKAGAVGTDYIFQLIKGEITSIPDSVQWNPVAI